MPIGQRDERVRVYTYSNVGVDGLPASKYTRAGGSGADLAFWARREPASAREIQRAQQAQHEVEWVFAFDINTVVTPDGILRHMPSGKLHMITGIYPVRQMRELIVHATEAADEVYNNVEE